MLSESDFGILPSASSSVEVILEGCLLKQGIRGVRQWNDRYFVFTSNNMLAYYSQGKNKDDNDDKPKFIYPVTKESGCEISQVYEESRATKNQHGSSSKETIYCIKLTWSMPIKRIADVDAWDESSVGPKTVQQQQQHRSGSSTPPIPGNGSSTAQQPQSSRRLTYSPIPNSSNNSNSNSNNRGTVPGPPPWTSERRVSTTDAVNDPSTPASPKRRKGSMVVERDVTPQRRTKSSEEMPKSRGSSYRFRIKHSYSEDDLSLDLPNLPMEERPCSNSSNNNTQTPAASQRHEEKTLGEDNDANVGKNGQRVPQQKVLESEQEVLHSVYLARKKQNKKKTKKKVVDGAKLALAAGAFVGLGVLTAGASVAGLLILGVAAAAGGTGAAGAAATSTWKRGKKRETELIIASASYEEAKRWHANLNACLQSASARESTWGQLFFQEGRSSTRTILPLDAAGALIVRSRDVQNSPRRGSDTSNGTELAAGDRFAFQEKKSQSSNIVVPGARWRPMEGGWLTFFGTGAQGLRIFREEEETKVAIGSQGLVRRIFGGVFASGRACPPLKAHVLLNASPLNAFMCLMSYARMPDNTNYATPNSGQRVSFRVLETIDDHMDVIHVISRPMYLFPSYTSPRDFVLFRYWRFESCGSCVVCYESIEHKSCPPQPDFVRGEMHAVYTISPKKQKSGSRYVGATTEEECLMTAVVQVDPKGWVPLRPLPMLSDQGYGEAFGISALLQLLDIRDAIDLDRFLPVGQENSLPSLQKTLLKAPLLNGFSQAPSSQVVGISGSNSVDSEDDVVNDDNFYYDFAFASRESSMTDLSMKFASHPEPFPVESWAEPDPNSFRVRGKTYKQDREKVNAGPAIGRLVAVDVLLADEAVYTGVSTHPNERIQLGLQRERALKEKGLPSDMPPFVFVVNIVLPGPPVYHGVFYFAVDDRSAIDGTDGTPSSKLCKEFLFGDDDKFRDKTFKLIPQIVQGNFLVRKAVGNTPAIMGTKLRQHYVRSDRFMEIILDCGSSSVASGVIRVILPYSVHLSVDMGFLLEGNDESTLPERIFGCVRMRHIGFGPHLRKISKPT